MKPGIDRALEESLPPEQRSYEWHKTECRDPDCEVCQDTNRVAVECRACGWEAERTPPPSLRCPVCREFEVRRKP